MTAINRVYLITGPFIAIIICFVFFIRLRMDSLNAVCAYTGEDGLWAKAQKDAVIALKQYVASCVEAAEAAAEGQGAGDG